MSQKNDSEKMLRGSWLLTVGAVSTQIMGMLYIIPFYSIMGGEENLALYGYAYTPYAIMLSFAIAGLPGAVSKFIAKYNALGMYKTSQKLYLSSFIVSFGLGIISFIILFFMAPILADIQTLYAGDAIWSTEDITRVIRVISFAIIIIPLFATWRGVFQGFESFGPTTASLVLEQLVRIIFLLAGTYIVIEVINGSIRTANEVAVFAAFIGGFAALFTLMFFWFKRKPHIDKMVASDDTGETLSYRVMYKEIISYSVPIILMGISISTLMLIDQLTHNNALEMANVPEKYHHEWFTILNLTTHKLVMIPTAFASAFGVSSIPFITKNYFLKQLDSVNVHIKTTLLSTLIFTIPAALGLLILSAPIYTAFYEYNEFGNLVLLVYAPVAILFALFTVTCSIMQGINKQWYTMVYIVIMFAVKLLINIPLIMQFYTVGAVLGTMISLAVGITLNLLTIKYFSKFKSRTLLRPLTEMVVYSIVMVLVVEVIYFLLNRHLDITGTMDAIIMLVATIPIAVVVYIVLIFKTGLADAVLGETAQKIRRKLRVL
ncbi:putative polysaccharide biosynthesis protein [Aliicoccus persicus]|uniref:Membrane protein involved in the export of O-antigen and teichoic acid n=1 Tax=Aliicoccus persicus TaxID=930138 RepID=A0A662Z363_9STAP|nr:polysaccharide biosynthesis protein [Aliicoccus persicus]SEV87866.1 Membrane protein involved in the export of O-antigen and teichoic acid [Aliicoccus persicus]